VAAQHSRAPVDATALGEGFLKVVDYAQVTPSPGAEAAIEAARNHARVGLVTNGPESRQAQKLDALAFGDRFETVVYAGDLPRRKPHRDPFDAALDTLDVAASDALYVGDSLEYDVAGAQNAGLASAWYSPTEADPEPYRPEHVLGSLSDLGGVVGP
jgi:putative hydrolase of the HAD superfamily